MHYLESELLVPFPVLDPLLRGLAFDMLFAPSRDNISFRLGLKGSASQ
jgi:hypothetical protein